MSFLDKSEIDTDKFRGTKLLTIEVELSGGKGDVAWQHAQLFRQAADSTEFPFVVTLHFIGSWFLFMFYTKILVELYNHNFLFYNCNR